VIDSNHTDSDTTTTATSGTQPTGSSEQTGTTSTPPPPSDTTVTTEKAPQTGQLWWPVPALAASGLLCFGIGLMIRKKNDEE
jgi:hypothetical protein